MFFCIYILCIMYLGDAETKPLSSLAQALGEGECSFYGITEVAHSDAVFQNISAPNCDITISCEISAGIVLFIHLLN